MKIAIVTGASSGMGREFARILDKNEQLDEIWGVGRAKENLDALAAELKTPLKWTSRQAEWNRLSPR